MRRLRVPAGPAAPVLVERPPRDAPGPLRLAAAVAAAALVAACLAVFGLGLEAAVNAAGCLVLVAITVTDVERRIIPNRIVLPALVAALVVQTARDPSLEWVLAALGAGGFFLVMALAYPAGLGMGDVKLAAFMGAWLGVAVVPALFLGSLLALVPAVVILVRHGSAGRKMGVPFGPFLAAGGLIALFAGESLLDAWLG
jgi:leader peptidase (prepilin peptidase)/N-methyltransferase